MTTDQIPPPGQLVTREYLDLRLDALESRIDTKLSRLEIAVHQSAVSQIKWTVATFTPLLVAIFVAVVLK